MCDAAHLKFLTYGYIKVLQWEYESSGRALKFEPNILVDNGVDLFRRQSFFNFGGIRGDGARRAGACDVGAP